MTTKCRACTREMTEWAKRNCEGFCTQCFHTTSALPEEKEVKNYTLVAYQEQGDTFRFDLVLEDNELYLVLGDGSRKKLQPMPEAD